jgi:hypothetical protein
LKSIAKLSFECMTDREGTRCVIIKMNYERGKTNLKKVINDQVFVPNFTYSLTVSCLEDKNARNVELSVVLVMASLSSY